jgi:hypothetical protein
MLTNFQQLQMSTNPECQAVARFGGQEKLGSKRELCLNSVTLDEAQRIDAVCKQAIQ